MYWNTLLLYRSPERSILRTSGYGIIEIDMNEMLLGEKKKLEKKEFDFFPFRTANLFYQSPDYLGMFVCDMPKLKNHRALGRV